MFSESTKEHSTHFCHMELHVLSVINYPKNKNTKMNSFVQYCIMIIKVHNNNLKVLQDTQVPLALSKKIKLI